MKEYVRTILDYPVKGIQFRDITTLLQDAGHFKQVIDEDFFVLPLMLQFERLVFLAD